MRTIIAGSRENTDFLLVKKAIEESGFDITEVVSGTCRGVDQHGEDWAEGHGIPITKFPADWNTYGKKAGYIRNKEMADYADALIAVWDGKSKGTKITIDLAHNYGLSVFVYRIDGG